MQTYTDLTSCDTLTQMIDHLTNLRNEIGDKVVYTLSEEMPDLCGVLVYYNTERGMIEFSG